MDKFTPTKPMRYPRADGTTMSQIELYAVLTDPHLNLLPIAKVVEPITRAEQGHGHAYPEIVVVR
jgi:hypothetical protein